MTLYLMFAMLSTFVLIVVSNAERAVDGLATALAAQMTVVAAEPTGADADGSRLFQTLGCIGCHRSDATGIGPPLTGLYGSAIPESDGLPDTVDDAYVRQSILSPTASVRPGFPPVMPTFAGRLSEGELQALVAYVRSLSATPQAGDPYSCQ